MKRSVTTLCTLLFILTVSGTAWSQTDKASEKFKKIVNRMVQKVEKAESPEQKRAIMNRSFERFMTAFSRVEQMDGVSDSDKEGIAGLRKIVEEKSRELNGEEGFNPVPDQQLDNFANYVQQDLEQADTVITISLTTLLLIIIILLLL